MASLEVLKRVPSDLSHHEDDETPSLPSPSVANGAIAWVIRRTLYPLSRIMRRIAKFVGRIRIKADWRLDEMVVILSSHWKATPRRWN